MNTDWCIPYKEGEPPKMYFCQSKLNVWANTADQAQEALRTTRKNLTPYFEKTHRDIAAQLAGMMLICMYFVKKLGQHSFSFIQLHSE